MIEIEIGEQAEGEGEGEVLGWMMMTDRLLLYGLVGIGIGWLF